MQLERAFSKLIVIREKFRILFSLKYGRITHMEISFGFSWNFLGLIELSYSTCFRLVLKLPMRSPYIVLVMSQKCPRFVLELSSSCLKSVLKLSKSCPKVVLELFLLSQSCPSCLRNVQGVVLKLSELSLSFFSCPRGSLISSGVVLDLSKNCLKVILKLSKSCSVAVQLALQYSYSFSKNVPMVFALAELS